MTTTAVSSRTPVLDTAPIPYAYRGEPRIRTWAPPVPLRRELIAALEREAIGQGATSWFWRQLSPARFGLYREGAGADRRVYEARRTGDVHACHQWFANHGITIDRRPRVIVVDVIQPEETA